MRFLLAATLIFSLAGLTGCEPKPSAQTGSETHKHDGHDHGPSTTEEKFDSPEAEFKAKLARAVTYAQTIQENAVKGSFDDHHELHEIGHLLEDLPKLAKAASVDDANIETLTTATKGLFESTLVIDKALHDSKEFKFDDVKESYEQSLAQLKTLADTIGK